MNQHGYRVCSDQGQRTHKTTGSFLSLLVAFVVVQVYVVSAKPSGVSFRPLRGSQKSELIDRCDLKWFELPLDHFDFATKAETFQLRYYMCMEYYKSHNGSLFVYLGNEADVTLYLNHTGLMWESAEMHGAGMVFLEHRYYGQSKPQSFSMESLEFLTTEQAMADYARVILQIKSDLQDEFLPVICFGGSYGGMLAAYFRAKYPQITSGAIAASAPIWTYFFEGYDRKSFAKIVTKDAEKSSDDGAVCVKNVRRGFKVIDRMGKTKQGRMILTERVKSCSLITDVHQLMDWVQEAWDSLAMANFPYESSYIVDGVGTLPAYPVREACAHLLSEFDQSETGDLYLVEAMAKAVGVYYNFTQLVPCYDIDRPSESETANLWSYQYCCEHFMAFESDGRFDMFYSKPFNLSEELKSCSQTWGVQPDIYHGYVEFLGKDILHSLSNVVFSNGLLDPWSGGGVLSIPKEIEERNNLRTIIIPEGAHHIDLMFSNPLDPESVILARKVENEMISSWIAEARQRSSEFTSQQSRISIQ